MFGNQIWCSVYVTRTANSDHENQAKVGVVKSYSEGAQGAEGTSTEEEIEEKECEEQSSSDEESSEEVSGHENRMRKLVLGYENLNHSL